jgi:hypothetical protein
MLPLRYPWAWKLVGWLLVAGVVFGSLMPGHSVPSVVSNDKLLHGATYFLLMIWFAGLYPRGRHLSIALGLLALGAALDLLQGLTSTRSFDLRDIAANAAGISAALVLSYWLLEGWCQRMEQWLAPS